MADFIFDDLNDIKDEVILLQEEYDQMIQQHPSPWSDFEKADFKVIRAALIRNQSKWEDELNSIKTRTDRLQASDPSKAIIREHLKNFKRDAENRRIQRELFAQIDRIAEYLLLEPVFTDRLSSRSSYVTENETQLDSDEEEQPMAQTTVSVHPFIQTEEQNPMTLALQVSQQTQPETHQQIQVSMQPVSPTIQQNVTETNPIVTNSVSSPPIVSNVYVPSIQSNRTPVFPQVQVPSLNIPKFTGEYLKWNAFWQIFEVAVHQQNYPKVSKLIALRSYLAGRALEEVESFSISGENYDTVVKALKDRFGNPQFVIREFDLKMNALRPALSNSESIRSTVVSVTNICREMKNFGIDINNYSMKNQVVSKLPPIERCKLELMLFQEPNTSIDTILEKMKIMEIEAELFSATTPSRQQMSSFSKIPIDRTFSTPVRQQTPTHGWKLNHLPKCSFCDGEHRSYKCLQYKTTEDRINCLKRKKLCLNCGTDGHLKTNCPKTNLKCQYCSGQHYGFLCTSSSNNSKTMLALNKQQGTLITKKVNISNPDRGTTSSAIVFFDSGAQRSFITNKLASKLQLPKVNQEILNVENFGGKISTCHSDFVKLKIQTTDGQKEIFANSTKQIADRVHVIEKKGNRFRQTEGEPDILIGMDYFWTFVKDAKESSNGIFVVNSIVGNIYCGTMPIDNQVTVSCLALDGQLTQSLPDDCEMLWKLESMGINDPPAVSNDDKIAQRKFNESVELKTDRYFVSWPFKSDMKLLPTNAGLALGRLRSTLKKLVQTPDLLQQYQNIIDDQLQRGTIEQAPNTPQGKIIHYLSHHAIITPQKTTTKVRMVFDASAKISKDAPSLNDCIYRGPIDLPEIAGLLFRIRMPKIVLTGDIEKAFHQIYLHETDRDAVRFFWLKDPSKPAEGNNILIYRFIGVPFGVIASPSILNEVIKLHIEKQNDPDLLQLLPETYVDNIHILIDDPDDALQVYEKVRKTFSAASMNVREWYSNDNTLQNKIPIELQQPSSDTKLLGLTWNSLSDMLRIELKNKPLKGKWTKRTVLQFVASTYDPIGLLSPVTIQADCLFVPGKLNPADLGTRGISLEELRETESWWNGPKFLSQPKEQWPKNPADSLQNQSLAADLTQTIIALVALAEPISTLIMQNIVPDREYKIDESLTWIELKTQVAIKIKDSEDITPIDLKLAEETLIRQEQNIYVSGKQMKEFKLFKDDREILLLNCRFDHADLINPRPVWIQKQSPIVHLIIMEVHESLHHSGVSHTLSKLREKYWIATGRAVVKKSLNKCSSCKLWKGKPFKLPKMPQLPDTRIHRSKPFENVGTDYCGPFKIKGKEEKVWIILFTCFTTRLIHLETVTSMTTEDFLFSFRKFVSRPGTPKYILSDNAKQFKTTSNALDQIWKTSLTDRQTTDFCLQHDIIWDFITERAPWKGGLYERLVGLVKNAMKQSIGKKFLNLNEFSTFVCEIEAILNTRPLTYVHSNEPIVIRPADFISPSVELKLPCSATDSFSDDPSYLQSNAAGGERIVERYYKTVEHLDKFWKIWSEQYLNFLRERNVDDHKHIRGSKERIPIAGELCLVYEPDQPRGKWKTAKIINLILSADREIRSAEIEYMDGFKTRRAINHLYPMEEAAAYLDTPVTDCDED